MKPLFQSEQEDFIVVEDQDWELIDRFDADSDTDSLHSVENGFLSWNTFTAPDSPEPDQEFHSENTLQALDPIEQLIPSLDYVGRDREAYYVEPLVFSAGVSDEYGGDGDVDDEEEEDEVVDDDGEDDGYGYGLDDELVPWQVSAKLGRQRMRKLGKRVFAKMSHASRNQYRYVKPGCVRGKHGLGIKA
ncbi:hypothetical protein Tsubulata_015998 [Turnera subulata]|uniref:Uncharacterized protein n=1 Tax=Turnera subulata TaxID=218843 RepID=A0A9Q0J8E9_9ROSI|nr:hypothetical protein Tsubulata_015998 [Turnera subulata]